MGAVVQVGCTGRVQELGKNGAETTVPGTPGTTTAPSATGTRKLASMSADGSPRSQYIGVAFIEEGEPHKVGFVMTDRTGRAHTDVIDLGQGADGEAGVAVAYDPTARAFYVGWAEGDAPARIHLHAIDEDALVTTYVPYAVEKTGELHGLDVFASGDFLLVSGFVTTSDLFLATMRAASGGRVQFVGEAQPGAKSPRTKIHGVRGDCRAGDGCVVTVRDATGAHPRFGMFGSPAIAVGVSISRTIDSSDSSEVGRTYHDLGGTLEPHDGGDHIRLAFDDSGLLSLGTEVASGEMRLQRVGQKCGAVTLRGCEQPTTALYRDDFAASTVGADADSQPAALALEDGEIKFALRSGASGDVLTFASRPVPGASEPPRAGSSSSQTRVDPKSTHTLAAPLAGDPVILKTAQGWTGLWVEGSRLFVRAL